MSGAYYAVSAIAGAALGWAGHWLKGYLGESGRIAALEQNFQTVLAQLTRTERATEAIRQELSHDAWLRQRQWDLRLELVREAHEAFAELKDAAQLMSAFLGQIPFQEQFGAAQFRVVNAIKRLESLRPLLRVTVPEELRPDVDSCLANPLKGLPQSSDLTAAIINQRRKDVDSAHDAFARLAERVLFIRREA